jgi:hypothetical protein
MTRYEVWNEPNATLFWHPTDAVPERYAQLYLDTHAALHRVDPGARVIVGGLALENTRVSSQTDFIRRMYRAHPELGHSVDAVGFHPYTPTVEGVYDKLREFRSVLADVGAGDVPIEITEVGWTTVGTREQERAHDLERLASELPQSDCNVQSLLPHTWATTERSPSDPEQWFGIYNHDATPKPSGAAYLSAVSRMRGLARLPATRRVCGAGAASSSPRRAKVVLRVRLRRRPGRRPRLVVLLRCPRGCRATLDLMRAGKQPSPTPLRRRSLRFSTRRRVVRLGSYRRRRLVLRVRAVGRSGEVTTRRRYLRLRCRRRPRGRACAYRFASSRR